jgi:Ca-activated chloride channel homolog
MATLIKRTLFTLFFCLAAVSAHASMGPLKRANRLFVKGNYAEALKAYNDALVDAPHSSVLHFNAGDAAYQTGAFENADGEFQQAAQLAQPPAIKSAAWYNRGNALFRQQRWADAIDAYKESLRINPNDADAKYNLGVALRAQKNPPKSQNQQQNQKQNQDQKQGQQKKQSSGGSSSAGQQPKPGEMSREDVERLLAAARSGELKKPNQKAAKNDVPHPSEDW